MAKKGSSDFSFTRGDTAGAGAGAWNGIFHDDSTPHVVDPFPGVIDDANPGPCAGVLPSRYQGYLLEEDASLSNSLNSTRASSGIGGGMLVGPNDPRWNCWVGSGQPGFPGIGGVPRGARYDPIGPPNVPGFEPARFARFPRRPGGGTHPDTEHFPGGRNYFL